MSDCGDVGGRRPLFIRPEQLTAHERDESETVPVDELPRRPRTRGDCAGGERPCPWASCKFHLYLEVNKNGTISLNFPDTELDEMVETCALDVADRGPHWNREVARLLGITHQRIQQIEEIAFRKYKALSPNPEEPGVTLAARLRFAQDRAERRKRRR